MKKYGAQQMIDNIQKTKCEFLILSSEERLKFLDKYDLLMPYQKTALIQCRKYMSYTEKTKFKQVIEKSAKLKLTNDEPQPN